MLSPSVELNLRRCKVPDSQSDGVVVNIQQLLLELGRGWGGGEICWFITYSLPGIEILLAVSFRSSIIMPIT